jgi:Tryptophan halogenase
VGGRFFVRGARPARTGPRLRGPATTALGRIVEGVQRRARTTVVGFPRGWAWYASTGDGRSALQIVLSSAQRLPKRQALSAFFDGLLDEIGPVLGPGQAAGEISARPADASRAVLPIEHRMIRVGDAALALDPLSGHGVFEAIASATAATPVINTILRRPEGADLARTFYEERVRVAYERFSRIGRDFYALERRWPDADFWRERRQWPDDERAYVSPLATPARIEEKPVVENGFIAARRVVVTADQPRGVWQVDRVPIVELLDWCRDQPSEESTDLRTAAAAHFRCAPDQIGTALDWLRYRRLIG